jgi:hypothetical protein
VWCWRFIAGTIFAGRRARINTPQSPAGIVSQLGSCGMSDLPPQANTKIERAVEAIESLALAVCIAQKALPMNRKGEAIKNVADARAECRTAFREFLIPTLRVVG